MARGTGDPAWSVILQRKVGLESPRDESKRVKRVHETFVKHLREQGGLLPRMPEGVNVPGHTGAPVVAKRIFQEAQSECHLVYDCSIVGGCLIVHNPATVGKLQAPCAQSRGRLSGPGVEPGLAM